MCSVPIPDLSASVGCTLSRAFWIGSQDLGLASDFGTDQFSSRSEFVESEDLG